MSRLETLIQQHCPDGVEYKKLGEIVSISRGASPRPIQNYLTDEEDGIPWIKIGDVSTNSKYITSTAERITREGANKSRFLKKGTFILSNSMSFGRPYILGIDGCIHDGWISICDFEASLNSDFLYYLLRSSDVQEYWISKANSGGAVANLNSDIVRSTPIPIPPLPVQEEIVRILDYLTELQAELQAELQKRLQQYNYYRDKLLSFNELNGGGYAVSVEWKKLGEIGVFYGGLSGKSKEDFKDGNAKFISYKNVFYNLSLNVDTDERVKIGEGEKQNTIQYGDVLFTGSSETPDECGMSSVLTQKTDEKLYLNSFCFGFRLHNPSLFCFDFLKHLFRSSEIRKQIGKTASGTTRFNVSKKRFAEVFLHRTGDLYSLLST